MSHSAEQDSFDVMEEYEGINDDDKSYFTLHNVKPDLLNLVGRSKEAIRQEKRAC